MYFYHHLGRGSGQFVERPDGLPVIYSDEILIKLTSGAIEQVITDKVRLLTQYLVVGLWAVEPADTPQKINETLLVAPRPVFDAAYLTLQDNTAKLLNKVPLRQLEKSNAQGHPYYVTARGFINMSESKLYTYKNDTVTDNQDAIKLIADYVIPRSKNLSDLKNHNK